MLQRDDRDRHRSNPARGGGRAARCAAAPKDLDDAAAGEQFIEPGITVGMNDAAEVLQMRLRMLAFAVGRVEEQRRRLPRTSERPLVANIGPQPVRVSDAGPARAVDLGEGRGAGVRKPPKNEPAGQRRGVGRLWGIGRAAALVVDGFAQIGEG